MKNRKYGICEIDTHSPYEGEFEIIPIVTDLYKQTEELFISVFPNQENLCIGTNLKESTKAIDELRQLFRVVVADGISFAARHVATHEIVALLACKIINPKKNLSLDHIFNTFTSPHMVAIGQILERAECTRDVYKEYDVESVLGIEFIAVHPSWGRRGLGQSLFAYVIEVGRAMSKGELPIELKANLSKEIREERPQVAASVLTTLFTQKMCHKLNFTLLTTIPMSELSFNGRCFTESIDSQHETVLFMALKL